MFLREKALFAIRLAQMLMVISLHHTQAFLSSASTAIYVFLYAIYYFLVRTKMYGLFQTCFYFGQISVLCLGVGIVCGTMGYLGARVFVFRIFKGMKGD